MNPMIFQVAIVTLMDQSVEIRAKRASEDDEVRWQISSVAKIV